MCFILLQTHDLESLPGEKLAQWWRNTVSFSTRGVVQMWDHATLKGPGGYNTKFQCEQTKFQHVLQCNPVFRFSCRFALSNSSSQIRVKWVDFTREQLGFGLRLYPGRYFSGVTYSCGTWGYPSGHSAPAVPSKDLIVWRRLDWA